jgi:hypothetical protein
VSAAREPNLKDVDVDSRAMRWWSNARRAVTRARASHTAPYLRTLLG